MVIPEWWTWWRWLVHSPTAWKASHEGLKALTPVPNPIRKSPQTQVTCGRKWRVGEKEYSCISITTCPYINTSYALWLCLVVWLLIVWVEICLFIFAYFHLFFLMLLLINLFLLMCQKSKNHIKSRKSKILIDIVEFCLKIGFALYLYANDFVHLRA